MPEPVTIFYSWQSDSPQKTNHFAIRDSLKRVCKKLELSSGSLSITVDDATREMSGSENILTSIIEKIEACDIFVCDVTTINPGTRKYRKTPNPNVVFELGYALALLGWPRVLMLYNTEIGKYPGDLPFDLEKHRISQYSLPEFDHKNKDKLEKLDALLKLFISRIIEKKPPRAQELRKKSSAEIQRRRDVETLKWVLSKIHLPTLNTMISDLPQSFSDQALDIWIAFDGVLRSPLFHLYDKEADKAIRDIHKAWLECMSHDRYFFPNKNSTRYVFESPPGGFNKGRLDAIQRIEEAKVSLQEALGRLLVIIRERYLVEIDLDVLSRVAWDSEVT